MTGENVFPTKVSLKKNGDTEIELVDILTKSWFGLL